MRNQSLFFISVGRLVTLTLLLVWASGNADEKRMENHSIGVYSCDNSNILFAPSVWARTGGGMAAQAEATMPGAYFRVVWEASATIGVRIDGSANDSCPSNSMPVIAYSVDEGPLKVIQLGRTGVVYDLPVADGLDKTKVHRLDFYFRASDLQQNRWKASTGHLRVAGIVLDAGGVLLPCPARPKLAVAFGDSITEGVGTDGLFTTWNDISLNNACLTWFPVVCTALNCEYGQVGTGGLGMTKTALEIPPLPQSWDHYDAAHSRLTDGRLKPDPDYIFCCLGTNDPGLDLTPDYIRWLIAARKACPHAWFFCIVPPLGVHKSEIDAAVQSRNKAGDRKVYLIDTALIKDGFRIGQSPTIFAYDGVHPSIYGHAMLASVIAAEVQKILCEE